MSIDKAADAEMVEQLRAVMQAKIDEAVAAFDAGKTVDEYFAEQDLPQERKVVVAADLREVGHFHLEFPAHRVPSMGRRQWVYQHRKDETVFVIGYANRMSLQQLGFAELHALVDDGKAAN